MRAAELRETFGRHGLLAAKSLGQNFLLGDEFPERIAESAGLTRETHVLEIGPGAGALTRFLCDNAGFVTAVELDRRLIPVLREQLADYANFEIIEGDIMKLDLSVLTARSLPELRVCANLPYNITTPVLAKLLESRMLVSVTVMIQREVARRVTARPGTADYGAFSVFAQYHADPQILFDVPPDAFFPRPKVTSSVIRLDTRVSLPLAPEDEAFFFRTVRAAFAQRRKTLVNALTAGFGNLTKPRIADIVRACGFDDNARGETLGIAEFMRLVDALRQVNT